MLPKMKHEKTQKNGNQLLRDAFINAFLQEMQYNHTPSTGSIFIFPALVNNTDKPHVKKSALSTEPQRSIIEQLQFLMNNVGLNISQLSDLLKVGRPSIYKWLDGSEIRRANLSRLEDIYYILSFWNNKYGVKIGSYLYKKIDKLSLYDLLIADVIEIERAKELSIKLNLILLGANDRAAQRRRN